MKAWVLHAVGDLRLEDVADPIPMPGWCLVRVKATGVCSSDIPRVFEKGTYHFPTTPGHEFSGIVESIGDSTDPSLLGARVAVFPLIPCRVCPSCVHGEYETCEHYDYLGSRRDGGFAELVAVPAWNLLELPESVPFEAAAMLEPLSVALHATRKAGIDDGSSVAVFGTGAIGFSVARWAVRLGAKTVTMVGRDRYKEAIAERMGVRLVTTEEVRGLEFDSVIEAVGSPKSISSSINAVRPSGTLVLMGNPTGDIHLAQDTYWRVLRKQLVLKGTWNSSYECRCKCDWSDALEAIVLGDIDVFPLITHRFGWDKLPNALELMRDKQEPYCKVMLNWE